MSRPRKGTKGAEEATRKWRKTMQRKYGGAAGVHNMMRIIGAKGGRNGHSGGFSCNPALARVAGSKGGSKSRRGLKFLGMKGRKYMYEVKRTGETIFLKEGERWHDVQEEED